MKRRRRRWGGKEKEEVEKLTKESAILGWLTSCVLQEVSSVLAAVNGQHWHHEGHGCGQETSDQDECQLHTAVWASPEQCRLPAQTNTKPPLKQTTLQVLCLIATQQQTLDRTLAAFNALIMSRDDCQRESKTFINHCNYPQISSPHKHNASLEVSYLTYCSTLVKRLLEWLNVPSNSSSALRRRHLRVAGRSNEENCVCVVLLKIGAQLACTMID